MITGSGTRTADSYNGTPGAAPLLHIEFATIDTSNNTAPVVYSGSVTVLEDAQDAALGLIAPTDADDDPLTITVTSLPDAAKGTVTLASGVAVTVGQTLTAAELEGLQYDTVADASGAAGSFVYAVSDSIVTVDGTVVLDITPVNDPPTVSLANMITVLAEGTDTSPAIKVADIVVSDDGLGTNGLTLSGDDAGLFEIVGTELRLQADVVLDIIGNPSLDVTVEVDDTTVGSTPDATAPLSISITIGSSPPSIFGLSGDSLNYTALDGSVVIEQGGDALVTDVDSADFAGGQLSVSISSGGAVGEDVLSVQDQGSGAGAIGFDGVNVSYGGVLIGMSTGGSGGAALVVSLTAAADAAAVTALVQAITYENSDTVAPTTGSRTVDFTLSDGDGGVSGTVSATVSVSAVVNQTLEVRVSSSSDDAEEEVSTGSVGLTSSDLELISEKGTTDQIVGMRFNGIVIPVGAVITSAYIQFQTDEVTSSATTLVIQGEAALDAQQFSTATGNISSRPTTLASADWLPVAWNSVGEANAAQQTSDLSAEVRSSACALTAS